jgi:hypothetical protein
MSANGELFLANSDQDFTRCDRADSQIWETGIPVMSIASSDVMDLEIETIEVDAISVRIHGN